MKTLIGKLRALRLYFVSKSFFCWHKWANAGQKIFDEPKMDSNGKLTTRMQIKVCEKCGKTKYLRIE